MPEQADGNLRRASIRHCRDQIAAGIGQRTVGGAGQHLAIDARRKPARARGAAKAYPENNMVPVIGRRCRRYSIAHGGDSDREAAGRAAACRHRLAAPISTSWRSVFAVTLTTSPTS